MSIPLIMTGPGGDYTTRYDIKGQSLVRQIGATLKQQPDSDSGSGFAGYYKQPRGKRQTAGQRLSGGPRGGLPLASADRLAADVFVHQKETNLDKLARTGGGIYQASGPVNGPVIGQAKGQATGYATGPASGHAGRSVRVAYDQDQAQAIGGTKSVATTGFESGGEATLPQVAAMAAGLTPAMYQAVKTWLDLQGRALGVLAQEAVALNQTNQAMLAGRRRERNQMGQMGQLAQLERGQAMGGQTTATTPGTAAGLGGREMPTDRNDTHAAETEAGQRMMALGHAAFTEVDDHGDESDSQATEDTHTDSRLAFDARLFADHAGTRPGVGRQQGYGLRARRGADQKGGLAATAKQGSLFGVESRH